MATQRSMTVQDQAFSFTPRTLDEALKYADMISNSAICPQNLKGRPGDVLVILQTGQEIGLKPMQSLRTLGCINGMPFAYGDGQLALIKNHPDFIDIKEWLEGDIALQTLIAHCTITRRGQEPQTRSFSMKDAKTAGLLGKGVWMSYPKRMLQHRARGFACRDVFPDALFGIMSQTEVEDMTPATQQIVVKDKGIAGLKSALGIKPTAEEMPTTDGTIIEGSFTISRHEELKALIAQAKLRESTIAGTLKKCSVATIDELNAEQVDKWITHLKSRETKPSNQEQNNDQS